jgi:fumarylacetoacetase
LEQQSGADCDFLKSRKRADFVFSPWVVTMEAMEQFIVPNMEMKNPILDYLTMNKDYNFDLNLAVSIKGENQSEYNEVGTSNFKVSY